MIEKKKIFFTVQLLRSKNDFSGGKAPEKINLGNNCRPNIYITIKTQSQKLPFPTRKPRQIAHKTF